MPALFLMPSPGAKRFHQVWYEHQRGCACALTATQQHRVVLGLLDGWAANSQLTSDEVTRSMLDIRQQAGVLESTSSSEALVALASGDVHTRSLLANHLVDHGVAAFFELLMLKQFDRERVASALLVPLAQMCTSQPDSSAWWLLTEVASLLTPQELYNDVPAGLLLKQRAMPVSPCTLAEVFDILQASLGTSYEQRSDDMLLATVTGLIQEWEGSFAELVAAAHAL